LRVDVLAHLAFSMFAATGVAYMVGQARVHGHYRWPLLALLLTPSFGVWASVVGRESLYIGCLGFFMGAVVGYFRARAACIACCSRWWPWRALVFIRAPFGGAMALFFVMAWDADARAARGPEPGRADDGAARAGCARDRGRVAATGRLHRRRSAAQGTQLLHHLFRFHAHVDQHPDLARAVHQPVVDLAARGGRAHAGRSVFARPVLFPFFASGLVVFFLLLYAIQQAFRAPRACRARSSCWAGCRR
jgi:hypothetical protein